MYLEPAIHKAFVVHLTEHPPVGDTKLHKTNMHTCTQTHTYMCVLFQTTHPHHITHAHSSITHTLTHNPPHTLTHTHTLLHHTHTHTHSPDGLHKPRIKCLVIVPEVDPSSHSCHDLLPLFRVTHNNLTALCVVCCHAHFLDIIRTLRQ